MIFVMICNNKSFRLGLLFAGDYLPGLMTLLPNYLTFSTLFLFFIYWHFFIDFFIFWLLIELGPPAPLEPARQFFCHSNCDNKILFFQELLVPRRPFCFYARKYNLCY